ncbi:GTP-binding protein [Microbacterium excoecariae]|uniref:GTP-binding protein n=1 Tax=Microbacterium excoecariae TaxID=2715210 RepID=UPI00140D525A|nr:GTP-binding protein [Microbacterium excoecariae]NHI16052.1 hypothetical protein [Microbacterium excoecariae]
MTPVDTIAIVGTCTPERARYAADLAREGGHELFGAARLGASPDPLDEAEALAPWAGAAGAVIELPAAIPVTEVIGRLGRPESPARLAGVIAVVDAPHLQADIAREDYLVRRAADGDREFRARALATVTQIEYATTVVLAGWDALATDDLSTTLALVSALSPRARIRLHPAPIGAREIPAPGAPVHERPGWIALLNDEHDPHMTDPRVRAARFHNERPFHPERLERVLDEQVEPGAFGTLVRSAGFCRLATRPGVTAHWEHVGSLLSLPPVGRDADLADDEELLAAGQDIALIGLDLDVAGLLRALAGACLTDAEFEAGPAAWRALADPFPAWAEA